MTTQEALEKIKLNIVNEKLTNKKDTINSRQQFLKYGVQSTIQTLWSNFPKLDSLGFDKIPFGSSELLALQKLESILYEKGIGALRNNFFVADVLEYIEVNGKIKFLKTKLEFSNKQTPIYVFETFRFEKNKLLFDYSIIKPEKISDDDIKEMLFNCFDYKPTEYIEVPYKIFYNNQSKKPDLFLVNDEYFKLLDKDIEVLIKDSYLSAPWIFATDNNGIKKQIQEGLSDLNKRFIGISPQLQMYDYDPLRILQSQSQSQIIIQKIEKNINWIKKFAFMKQDSNDFGTKNMHNVEAQQINSDFEDYIEAKANLRELQFKEFLDSFYPDLRINKVLIYGSTEWLITEAKKYVVNMNGSFVGQNLEKNLETEVNEENGNNEN
ncbi:hypothetical protein ACT1UH_02955 [Mycoplasma sp. 332]|uniref:hypothetical protein n=1 Tax=Mycoplasma sp. 332 TaxID=3458236 RepID=UPI0040363218